MWSSSSSSSSSSYTSDRSFWYDTDRSATVPTDESYSIQSNRDSFVRHQDEDTNTSGWSKREGDGRGFDLRSQGWGMEFDCTNTNPFAVDNSDETTENMIIDRQEEHKEEKETEESSSATMTGTPAAVPFVPRTKAKFRSPAVRVPSTMTQNNTIPASSSTTPIATILPATHGLKPIRFVKSKEVLHTNQSNNNAASETNANTAASSASLLGTKMVQSTPSLLASSTSSYTPAASNQGNPLRSMPSLLTPHRRVGLKAPGPQLTATSSSVTPRSLENTPTASSTMNLAHIFKVTYCHAAAKKKQHREGYLHLFRSIASLTTTSSSVPQPPSFHKSQLYTDRGVLVDELLGHGIMSYDESFVKPPPRNNFPGRSSRPRFTGDEVDAGILEGTSSRKRRREDEEDDEEDVTTISPHTSADRQTTLVPNTFALGEFVILGRFECELEEEISHAEYEFTKKLMTGIISHAPISKHSSLTSITIDGARLDEFTCPIGYKMLQSQGLDSNVIGKNSNSLKEPIPLTYIRQDVRPGIGFREKIKPPTPSHDRGVRGRGGGRGARGGFRGGC